MSCPLVIDLDGTLLNSDVLIESGLSYVRTKPFNFYNPLLWLLVGGKAGLKEKIANSVSIDVANLPYNQKVIELIEEERTKGRQIILATASHQIYADQIANHLGVFDVVFATNNGINLSSKNKREKLVSQFGENGFEYIGNSKDDLHVWSAARTAHVVNPELGVLRKVKSLGNVGQIINTPRNQFKSFVKQMRFHQWAKNLLLFVPLLASHKISQPDLLLNGLLAFLFFGFCASSVYVLNDLLDLGDDRHHPTKRKRPFASGELSLKLGIVIIPILLIIAFAGSYLLLPWKFTVALAVYYILTLLYSLWLKRKVLVDVITLAMLYTLRVIAGTMVFGAILTFWLLAFSIFIFLSLALVKRYAELKEAGDRSATDKIRGRGYYPEDMGMISSLGAASGYLAVLVMAFYIQDKDTVALYHYPQLIWLACPLLLYWISRIWLLTHRGLMYEDPVVFALKDRISIMVGFLFGVIFWVAS